MLFCRRRRHRRFVFVAQNRNIKSMKLLFFLLKQTKLLSYGKSKNYSACSAGALPRTGCGQLVAD
jgi:hypothetical protein